MANFQQPNTLDNQLTIASYGKNLRTERMIIKRARGAETTELLLAIGKHLIDIPIWFWAKQLLHRKNWNTDEGDQTRGAGGAYEPILLMG